MRQMKGRSTVQSVVLNTKMPLRSILVLDMAHVPAPAGCPIAQGWYLELL